jgi:hypothetical protein
MEPRSTSDVSSDLEFISRLKPSTTVTIPTRLIAIQAGFMMRARARPSSVRDPFQRPVAHAGVGSGQPPHFSH